MGPQACSLAHFAALPAVGGAWRLLPSGQLGLSSCLLASTAAVSASLQGLAVLFIGDSQMEEIALAFAHELGFNFSELLASVHPLNPPCRAGSDYRQFTALKPPQALPRIAMRWAAHAQCSGNAGRWATMSGWKDETRQFTQQFAPDAIIFNVPVAHWYNQQSSSEVLSDVQSYLDYIFSLGSASTQFVQLQVGTASAGCLHPAGGSGFDHVHLHLREAFELRLPAHFRGTFVQALDAYYTWMSDAFWRVETVPEVINRMLEAAPGCNHSTATLYWGLCHHISCLAVVPAYNPSMMAVAGHAATSLTVNALGLMVSASLSPPASPTSSAGSCECTAAGDDSSAPLRALPPLPLLQSYMRAASPPPPPPPPRVPPLPDIPLQSDYMPIQIPQDPLLTNRATLLLAVGLPTATCFGLLLLQQVAKQMRHKGRLHLLPRSAPRQDTEVGARVPLSALLAAADAELASSSGRVGAGSTALGEPAGGDSSSSVGSSELLHS